LTASRDRALQSAEILEAWVLTAGSLVDVVDIGLTLQDLGNSELSAGQKTLAVVGAAMPFISGRVLTIGNKRCTPRDAPKSTFTLPKTWRSAKGVTGKFSDGKHTFRIDTHNLSPGEKFHAHIYNARGKEIAVIQGRGTNGIWRPSHRGQTLLKPSEVGAELRTDIRRLIRNALSNID
jgi:hypothetical protein